MSCEVNYKNYNGKTSERKIESLFALTRKCQD